MTTLADAWAQGWCEGVRAGWASTGTTPPDSWNGVNPYEGLTERAERRTARNAVAAKERAEDDLEVLRNGVGLIVAELESVISMLMEEGDTHDAVIAGTHQRVAQQLRDVLNAVTDRADRIAHEEA